MTGTVLDKYEILQKVGEGGMATVYRGRHVTLGRDVAIKILHPHLSASIRNRQRFAREARAIEHLDHDNILKIFDYSGTDTDDCYIVTEFVDGVNLHQVLTERKRVPSEVASIIGLKLAVALEYAHSAGIIHRDLKPENVMIRRDGVVKLMDFGIARFLDEANLTMTGALVGSPAYMSPEQAMERVLDPRSDLFSLGTVLFHLVTGQLPFAGGNPSIILRNIIEGNRPEVMELVPEISGALADLIEQLLQTSVDARPHTASEVKELLAKTLGEVGIDWTEPRWALASWLVDPGTYEAALTTHVKDVLLEQGRARLAAGDHLGALRLLNRLLSMDEDNAEVLELVQGMHSSGPTAEKPRRRWVFAAVGLGLSLVAGWVLWPLTQGERSGGAPSAATPSEETGRAPSAAEATTGPVEAPAASAVAPAAAPVPASVPAVASLPPDDEPQARAPRALPASAGSGEPAAAARAARPPSRSLVVAAAEESLDAAMRARGAPPDPPAQVTVVVPGSWGNIFIDDQLKGRTGKVGAIEVSPGTHVLRVENDLALPYTVTFTVAPGEQRTLDNISLQRKPLIVQLDPSLATDCVVEVDGVSRGQVSGLGYRFAISEPDVDHRVRLTCPGSELQEFPVAASIPGAVIRLGAP